MGAVELRDKLIGIINNSSDEKFLRMVNALQKSYFEDESSDNEIVAYTVEGQPLNRKEYIRQIKEAEAQIERGEYITVEDLERESANW